MIVALLAGCDSSQKSRATVSAAGAQDVTSVAAPAPAPGGRDFAMAMRSYREGDHVRALQRFTELAERGHANAQYAVGVMLADGQGTLQDWDAAAQWYQKAAAQNQPDALRALARLHVFGVGGVEVDIPKAIALYERAEQAYPPGEARDNVAQQRQALVALQKESVGGSSEPAESEPAR